MTKRELLERIVRLEKFIGITEENLKRVEHAIRNGQTIIQNINENTQEMNNSQAAIKEQFDTIATALGMKFEWTEAQEPKCVIKKVSVNRDNK